MKSRLRYLPLALVLFGVATVSLSSTLVYAGEKSGAWQQDVSGTGQATLRVEKHAGGDGRPFSFVLAPPDMDGNTIFAASESFTPTISIAPGEYTLKEIIPQGWRLLSVTCKKDGDIYVLPTTNNPITLSGIQDGDTVVCTYSNEPLGTIIVSKVTSPAVDNDFSFHLSPGGGFTLSNGENQPFALLPGSYSVSETVPDGWDQVASCSDGSNPAQIQLGAGEIVSCTFTNTAQLTSVQLKMKATPLQVLPGGTVQYDYEVTNTSFAALPLHDVVVSDEQCAPLSGPTGDVLNDQLLGPGEVWTYTCSMVLTVDTVSTASVSAKDFVNRTVSDSASAFVDVLPTVVLDKSVSPPSRPEPGGPFLFTLTITNTSTEPVRIKALHDAYPLGPQCEQLVNDHTILSAGTAVSCQYDLTLTTPGVYINGAAVTVRETTNAHPTDTLRDASDQATATATVINVPSSLAVTKRAQPSTLPAPGGPVTFTLWVTNTSSTDTVTLTQVADDADNDGAAEMQGPAGDLCDSTTLAPTQSTRCRFARTVTGSAGAYTDLATITATDDDTNTVSATAEATVYLVEGPILEVEKTPSAQSVDEPGGAVSFMVTVTNHHPARAVTLTTLQDSRFGAVAAGPHDGITSTNCALATILAAGSYTCAFTARVNGNAGDVHTNMLTATATDTDGNSYSGNASADVHITDLPSSLKVTLSTDRPSVPEKGATVVYALSVKNTSAADSITLNNFADSLYGNVADTANHALKATNCTTGQTLAPGATYICAFSALIGGTVGEQHTNTLTVTAGDDDGGQLQGQDSATVAVVGSLGAATKRVALVEDANQNGVANPGDLLGYTVVISNVGNSAGSFTFVDVLDANTALVAGSITASQGIVNPSVNGLTVTPLDLAAGASATIAFQVRVKDPLPVGVTSVDNQGLVTNPNAPTVLTDDPDTPTPADSTKTLVIASPVLAMVKNDTLVDDVDQDGVAGPGDLIAYMLTVMNGGNQAASALTLEDTPDANTTLLAGSVTANNRGQVVSGNNAGDKHVQVNLPTPLPVGGQMVVTFRVRINASLPINLTTLSNQALVSAANLSPVLSDDPETPALGDATLTSVSALPNVKLFKSVSLLVDSDKNGLPSPGDTLVYQLSLSNSGAQTAAGVRVTDLLDANTTLIAGSVQRTQGDVMIGNNPGDTSVEIDVGTLAADAHVTISFHVLIDEPLQDTVLTVSNQASVGGDNFTTVPSDDPNTGAIDDPTVTPITAAPLILVSKRDFLYQDADQDDQAGTGDTLLYVIQIANNGNIGATNVHLVDTPDGRTALLWGKVQTNQGTVILGNGANDARVEIDLGTLAPRARADLGFRVTIGSGTSLTVANQATLEYVNPGSTTHSSEAILSDDPDTATAGDATLTPLKRDSGGSGGGPLYLPLVFQHP